MKVKSIVAHHGSPGHPDDFLHLKKYLKDAFEFYTPHRGDSLSGSNDNRVEVGYSFGAVLALQAALENNSKEVILISPYLFPESAPSTLKKSILKTPGIGALVLGLAGKKGIEQMLVESSYPSQVPETYIQDSLNYLIPYRLRTSVLEKDINPTNITNLLSAHAAKGTKISILRGREDKTSAVAKQVKPIIDLTGAKEYILDMAGHALLWTHPKKLAEHITLILTGQAQEKAKSQEARQEKLGYFDGEHIGNNVSSFLTRHLKDFPTREILSWVSPGDVLKWDGKSPLVHSSVKVAELDHLVSVIAHGFSELGLKKGDRVIIFIPMSLYLYAAMFAVQRLGAIAVFLDSWARRDQLGKSAEVVSPKMIVSVERAFGYLAEVPEINAIPLKVVAGPHEGKYTASLDVLMGGKNRAEPVAVEKEHTALVTFTTGSSGTPKGADRGHRFLAAQHYALNRHLPYNENDVDLPVFPIFSLNNLAAGVKTVIPAIDVGTPNEKDALILYNQMKQQGVTCTTLSPSLFNAMSRWCKQTNQDLSFLRRIITGGAPVSNDDVANMKAVAPNAEILVLYGSTEVEPMAHIEAKEMLGQKRNADPEIEEEGVNVGLMDEGLQVKYLKINKDPIFIKKEEDWKAHEVAKGEIGEIIVAGEHVCQGYWNNEEAFFRAKIRDHHNTVWHRTGDLGKVDSHGNLWLVGRVHNAISRAGKYYFPVRAEVILKKLPFVQNCAYLGVADDELGEKTFAVISIRSGAAGDEDTWKSEVSQILQKNGVVTDGIVITDEIPMDPRHHSKVEYGILRDKLFGQKS
tara:strand:- start:17484 stop:19892 length:2409 start_codon:yes stop_codon:yes gene_type:complete